MIVGRNRIRSSCPASVHLPRGYITVCRDTSERQSRQNAAMCFAADRCSTICGTASIFSVVPIGWSIWTWCGKPAEKRIKSKRKKQFTGTAVSCRLRTQETALFSKDNHWLCQWAKSFSYGQNKNSLIYLKLRFANPTKIYQGGPNHEREGHK